MVCAGLLHGAWVDIGSHDDFRPVVSLCHSAPPRVHTLCRSLTFTLYESNAACLASARSGWGCWRRLQLQPRRRRTSSDCILNKAVFMLEARAAFRRLMFGAPTSIMCACVHARVYPVPTNSTTTRQHAKDHSSNPVEQEVCERDISPHRVSRRVVSASRPMSLEHAGRKDFPGHLRWDMYGSASLHQLRMIRCKRRGCCGM